MLSRTGVTIAIVLAVGGLYLWIARAANDPFYWRNNLSGYYNYLARGFANGHLYLPIEPSPALLKLSNPWDPQVDFSLKVRDVALFNRRYYLYHGATPAVLLFLPWRLLSGHDVSENFGLFLFCFAGFLFSAGALSGLLQLADAKPSLALWAVMLIAMGTCQCVPYLLNRVWVYEVAIGVAYFCMSAAFYFLVRAAGLQFAPRWLALSGLFFGLAIGARPHMGLAALIALAGVSISRRRPAAIAAFALPLALVALAIATYNYARFGDPLEFGVRYLLAGENQQRVKLSAEFVLPGLYFLCICAPRFTPVFPWVLQVFRSPYVSAEHSLPQGYFLEPIIGGLYLAPFLMGILLLRKSGARLILRLLLASAASVLLFIAATGFSTQRYQPDFLAPAVLAAAAIAGIFIARTKGLARTALTAAFAVFVAFGAVVNLALSVTGPYDGLLKNASGTYLGIARALSPFEDYRPALNPRVAVDFSAEFNPHSNEASEPLLTMGDHTYRYFLYAQQAGERLRIVSQCDASTVEQEIERPAVPVQFHVEYLPSSGKVGVSMNGRELLQHDVKKLLTAPWQITVGENRIDPGVTARRFTGKIRKSSKSVRAGSAQPIASIFSESQPQILRSK